MQGHVMSKMERNTFLELELRIFFTPGGPLHLEPCDVKSMEWLRPVYGVLPHHSQSRLHPRFIWYDT